MNVKIEGKKRARDKMIIVFFTQSCVDVIVLAFRACCFCFSPAPLLLLLLVALHNRGINAFACKAKRNLPAEKVSRCSLACAARRPPPKQWTVKMEISGDLQRARPCHRRRVTAESAGWQLHFWLFFGGKRFSGLLRARLRDCVSLVFLIFYKNSTKFQKPSESLIFCN